MTYRFILGLLVAASVCGCSGGSSSGGSTSTLVGTSTASAVGTGTIGTAIVLKGAPPGSATVGAKYSFRPSVSSGGNAVVFSIAGMPSWAAFDTSTGTLSGTPATGDVGLSAPITITASDGVNTGTLAPFMIRVDATAGASAGPTISGAPMASVLSGHAYSFTPATTDPRGAALAFSIKNTPGWATFNAATGELSGTPTAADVGTYSNIAISASDGTTSVSLPAFAIAVTQIANGSATLSWAAPTQNTNGSPLTNLAGYRIYYGTSTTTMTQSVQIVGPGILTYVIPNLSPGTWYFSVKDYTSAGVESDASAVVSTTII